MTDANSQPHIIPVPHHCWERTGQATNGGWEAAMDTNERNTYGCPLHNQSGADGIKNFELLVARLSADERAAFEAERAARNAEREHYTPTYGRRA